MKSIIPVNNRYQIELDRYSWQIAQWKTLKKHPDGGKFEGTHWFPTLEMAVKKLVELQIAEADLKGTRDVIDALRASTSRLAAAIERSEHENLYAAEHRVGGA